MKSIYVLLLICFLTSCNDETTRLKNYEVQGIDVSHYQAKIDWPTVKKQNIHFAFVKASEGETLSDSIFQYNWEAIKKEKIKRGAYHFFIPSLSAIKQTENFTSKVNLEDGDLPPVLDIESHNNLPKSDIVIRAKLWLSIIEHHYDIRPIIYTNQKFYNKYLADNFDGYPIWIARYGGQKPALNSNAQWHFWQYGNRGRLEGIDGFVDFNVFKGTPNDLEAMCKGSNTSLSLAE